MICLVVLFAITATVILHLVFVRKISNKTYTFFVGAGNFILSLVFVVLFIAISFIKANLDFCDRCRNSKTRGKSRCNISGRIAITNEYR